MIYLSIFSPARLSLLTRPGRVDRDLEVREFFLARVRPKMLFLVILQYKTRGRPPKPGPDPSPSRKLRPDTFQRTIMGRIFLNPKNPDFFQPDLMRGMDDQSSMDHIIY
jgi:hypothetical protein